MSDSSESSGEPARIPSDRIPTEEGWCDFWHTHVDWKGDGNGGIAQRRPFLQSLFQLYHEIENRLDAWSKPAQTWAVIDAHDSSQDAVYIHTANPNQDNFPYQFESVVWDADRPSWLVEFVDSGKYQVGRYVFNEAVSFWVRRAGPAVR
jgi:hypothetical protein